MQGKRRKQSGNAMIEVALMAPWIFFLFVGILDFGFYAYAAICTQNAARVAAQFAAKDQYSRTQAVACQAALTEMKNLPNMVTVTTCATTVGAMSAALPLAVPAPEVLGPVASCPSSTGSSPDNECAVRVSVTYRSIPMIPIPGLLTGQMQLTREASMRTLE